MRHGEERGRGRRGVWRREELERDMRGMERPDDRERWEGQPWQEERWPQQQGEHYGYRDWERMMTMGDLPYWQRQHPVERYYMPHFALGHRYSRDVERGFFERLRDFFSHLGEPGARMRNRGPKGWKRSDEKIYEEICETIDETGIVDASDVTVRVEAGEVTLDGAVSTRRDKRLLEDIIEEVRGVHDIHNNLRIRREEPSVSERRSDKPRREIS